MSGSRAVLIELTGLHFGNPLMFCCHNCNNRKCINPDHLRWDTRSGNTKDAVKAGTNNLVGNKYKGNSKITAEQLALIKTLNQDNGWGPNKIWQITGINPNTINTILYHKRNKTKVG